jgi:predicted DNA-binding transcriptional regulator YafY
MPVNKNALVRYKTIDKCLQNRYRTWTLEDLIDECSDVLYEYEGIDKGISKRTIQMDIQMMRSEKLGYSAPIIVVDRKFYTYEDQDYSITNIPLTEQDLSTLSETVEILRQFKGFSHFQELDGMVQKLEDHVYSAKSNKHTVIDIEKNENLKGLKFLDELYKSIIEKRSINITYQSFKARQANSFDFHPYHLKEFRNRWFLIGTTKVKGPIVNLALDRMIELSEGKVPFYQDESFDSELHFKDVIGVSVSGNLDPIDVVLFVTHVHSPYVITKPLHSSQQVLSRDNYGITISIRVQHNFELEKEILAFGDGVKVVSPPSLRRNITNRIEGAMDLYNTELSKSGLISMKRQLENKGVSILKFIYTQREVKKIKLLLDRYFKNNPEKSYAKRRLLKELPALKGMLLNKNIKDIVSSIDPDSFLIKATYFDKVSDLGGVNDSKGADNWYVTWHQDVPINVVQKKKVAGYSGWTAKNEVISVRPPVEVCKSNFTLRIHLDDASEHNGALKVIPGSHNKFLAHEEIALITANSVPFVCEVPAGGVQLMKPLLLHSSGKSNSKKKRRVIHLEFSSMKLAGGLEWSEKEEVN